MSEWVNESLNQKMNELSESKSQSMHEWVNGLDCNGMEWNGMEWKGINGMQRNATQCNGMEWNGWISEAMNQWITEWTNEWMDNTPWMAPFLCVNPPMKNPWFPGDV